MPLLRERRHQDLVLQRKNDFIVELGSPDYRPNTQTSVKNVNFALYVGAIGDYICHCVALKWIFDTQPHVRGTIYAPDYFIEIPMHLFHNKKGWKVLPREALTEDVIRLNPTFIPSHDTVLNGTGTHLVDLGFVYFANRHHAPSGCYYPKLDLDYTNIAHSLPNKYVVLTPGATDENREMPPKLFNLIQDHVLAKGLMPVYLGKAFMTKCHITKFSESYDLSKGINLIEKTSLLEAAKIMASAKMVIGLDNGLLHLAACTSVPIIFGYNVIGPEYRRPRRPDECITIDIFPDKAQLPCTFCMSEMRFFFGHNFKKCIYKDNECLNWFDRNPNLWTQAVDKILCQ